jgi:hypothetical protein
MPSKYILKGGGNTKSYSSCTKYIEITLTIAILLGNQIYNTQ